MSGFGLSAFFFSTISHLAFKSDTSSFLLTLALGTSCPMILGFFLVRPIPLPAHELVSSAEYGAASETNEAVILQHDNDSHTPLLSESHDDELPSANIVSRGGASLELSPSRSPPPGNVSHRRSRGSAHRPSFSSAMRVMDSVPNVHGIQLWMTSEFWSLFIIMSLRKHLALCLSLSTDLNGLSQ